MSPTLLMLAALSAGQPVPGGPPGPPGDSLFPATRAGQEPPGLARVLLQQPGSPPAATDPPAAATPLNLPVQIPATPPAAAAPAAPAATPADRWYLMREPQGTWLGALLDDNRTSISGWVDQSFTASTAGVNSQPVVWNDRANQYLLQQFWVRIERSVVTTGTAPTWGYRIDNLYGTDYRFVQQRGLFNSQLESNDGYRQNLYGYDPIQFYVNAYVPTLFKGTDFRVGRLYTPWGYESLEAISTPFVSRSYAFNWSPPFTHMGIQVSPQFTDQLSGKFMLANGNDVFFTSSQEARFVGVLTYVTADKRDTFNLGTSFGRGAFNSSHPFAPATLGEQNEPAGRNNLNAFDFVYNHIVTSRLTYSAEGIYGYQTGVPANVAGGIIKNDVGSGTAHWGSIAQYLTYSLTPQLNVLGRFELFDDFQGQRTGFNGLYTAITGGMQYRPIKDVLIRPEVRFDYNGYSLPFENRHGIFTAAIDAIVRF